MVVSVRRSKGNGYFVSNLNNNLLCCYEIHENQAKLSMLLRNLYKNEARCSYVSSLALLNMVLGYSNFRTLDFKKIGSLVEYEIPVSLDEDDEEEVD